MTESKELRAMRQMAWERAKGELASLLRTYWDDSEKYNAMRVAVEDFVTNVEDYGLQE